VVVITTNIDDLHERAGSKNVLHLHGNIFEQCDIKRRGIQPCKEDIKIGDLHEATGIQLRPNTVLFNENYSPNKDIKKLTVACRITPEAGKIVVFPSTQMHASSNPINTPSRYVINFVFETEK
jgi:NAD-dependent deacetylase